MASKSSDGRPFPAGYFLRENNCIGEFLHGTSQPTAHILHSAVGFFFTQVVATLDNCFCSLRILADFKLSFHLSRLSGESDIVLFKLALGNRIAYLLANELDRRDLL